jgi:uncharacterized protein (TIGR02996 family)
MNGDMTRLEATPEVFDRYRVKVSPHLRGVGDVYLMRDGTLLVSPEAYDAMTGPPSTLQALKQAVALCPEDDARRLALADYAQEHGLADVERDQLLAVALRHVLAAPDDDDPRLDYADVAERFGDVTRAEFIRAQCLVARVVIRSVIDDPSDRVIQLDPRPPIEVIACRAHLMVLLNSEASVTWRTLPWGLAPRAALRRGFLEVVTCTGAQWDAHGDAVCAAHPVRDVRFVDDWPRFREDGETVIDGELCHHADVAGRRVSVRESEVVGRPGMAIMRALVLKRWPSVRNADWATYLVPDDEVASPGPLKPIGYTWPPTSGPPPWTSSSQVRKT